MARSSELVEWLNTDWLPLCAIVRHFDMPLLRQLSGCDEATAKRFLASDLVLPVPATPHAWQLRPDLRQTILTQLRASPDEELTLQRRALRLFLPTATDQGNVRQWDESATFHQLERLYYLLYQKQDWQAIQRLVNRLRQATPHQHAHAQRLDLYQAYVLLHNAQQDEANLIFERLHASDNLESYTKLRTLNGLAMVAMYKTHHDGALTWLTQLHAAALATNDQMYQGVALINQSIVYMDLHYFREALDRATMALTLYQKLSDGPLQLYAHLGCGKALLQLGRWQEAASHLQSASALADQLNLNALARNVYWAQGLLHHLTGKFDTSEAFYKRALSIAQSKKTGDARIESDTLWYLGFLFHTQRRDREALAAYDQALTLAEQLDRPHWQSIIGYRRGDLLQRQGDVAAARADFKQAIQLVEGLRGDSESERAKLGLIDSTQQLFEAMARLCVEQDEMAMAFDYVERARSQAFLDQLRRKEPHLYTSVGQPTLTLDEVQAALPEGTLLLEYFTTGLIPRGESFINQLPDASHFLRDFLLQPPTLLLFAITRHGVQLHPLPLDPNRLQPTDLGQHVVRRLLRPRQLAYLYQELLAPVHAEIAACDMLYIVPHGPLHHVPWMALKAPNGRYLLEEDGPAIALSPSATLLLRPNRSRPAANVDALLALGYNGSGDEKLRYAELEAVRLAQMVGGQASVGERPKLVHLAKGAAHAARWLHFSGHARFHPHRPLDSELWFAPSERPTALELMRLDLSVDLVSLSACTSGLNHVAAGDELMGLPRAFLYAGCPTVVCSMWEAADLVALLLMERFYEALRDGQPPAPALQAAQIALRTMTGHELHAQWVRWQQETPVYMEQFPPLDIDDFDALLFAAPEHWALFTVVGRGR